MFRKLICLVLFLAAPIASVAEANLMMVEQNGCHWCDEWNQAIAPIYPKTEEGKIAPLLRQELREPFPENVEVVRKVLFTPTFLLIVDGVEVGRVEGYPGEDLFWAMLKRVMQDSLD